MDRSRILGGTALIAFLGLLAAAAPAAGLAAPCAPTSAGAHVAGWTRGVAAGTGAFAREASHPDPWSGPPLDAQVRAADAWWHAAVFGALDATWDAADAAAGDAERCVG